jgi:hypothetical protein
MESREIHCQRCNKNTQHTFRYHITKTKHYSVVSVGSGKKEITVVCHVCLLETSIDKNDSKELVKQYDNEIATGEANELMDKGKDSKAENKLRKVLKKDPEFPQALYSISKCLISQAKYGEAEFYIKILENKFPDIPEIKELRDSLPPKLVTNEPKKEIISRDNNSDEGDKEKKLEESKRHAEKAERELEEKKKRKEESRNKMKGDEKLEESKRQVEKVERELEEKKKRKEESRNKMKGDEKLEESKRQVEKAERELEEKKKRKEESRNNREIDKEIAINEEKIRKIEEESKKLDEED